MSCVNSIHVTSASFGPESQCHPLPGVWPYASCLTSLVCPFSPELRQVLSFRRLQRLSPGWKETWERTGRQQKALPFLLLLDVWLGHHGVAIPNNGGSEPGKARPGLRQWYGPPKVPLNSWFVKIRWVEVLFKFTAEGQGREQALTENTL